tara:strand:- start:5257 stop:5499 length:243 start_codon:yes stop_codon:yes gene_type:complete
MLLRTEHGTKFLQGKQSLLGKKEEPVNIDEMGLLSHTVRLMDLPYLSKNLLIIAQNMKDCCGIERTNNPLLIKERETTWL